MGKNVGQYVQQLREAQGLELYQLAKQIGLSDSYLSMVEYGQCETAVTVLYDIVKSLGGDFMTALCCLAADAGIPAEALRAYSDFNPEIKPHVDA